MRAVSPPQRYGRKSLSTPFPPQLRITNFLPQERLKERRRHDQQVPNSIQSYSSSRHHRRVGRNHHRSFRIRGVIEAVYISFRYSRLLLCRVSSTFHCLPPEMRKAGNEYLKLYCTKLSISKLSYSTSFLIACIPFPNQHQPVFHRTFHPYSNFNFSNRLTLSFGNA